MLCGLSFRRKKGKKQQHPNKSRTPSPSPEELASCSVRSLPRTPPPTRPAPPPSPPVPTHPVAPVAPEPPGPLTLSSCPVCGRTFVPESLFKHVKICEKMAAKKRKTFDSSRQRREGLSATNGVINNGTDLEQYLPKNFGLPDNSPFLEKSPPCTAKPTPKAKPAAVRHAITKVRKETPSAELQRCPHCTRAFGPRAFERHVEWCADKAKILPAAPAQAPARLSDAKQRLNARTQYKAPPVRGRLSSQSRDKCSMSRSTSVESSRAVSPPRERADSRHERVRASESLSSNDDVSSPHVPVIRTSRGAPAGDAGVRARQARLARDLSSSSNPLSKQNPSEPSSDAAVTKNTQFILKDKVVDKKEQQKKLLELAQKYKNKNQKYKDVKKEETERRRQMLEKILAAPENDPPPLERPKSRRTSNVLESRVGKEIESPKANKSKPKPLSITKKAKEENKITCQIDKLKNESTMSLDSLDDRPSVVNLNSAAKRCQSIGINTELLCIPCVIHDSIQEKNDLMNCRRKITDKVKEEYEDNLSMHMLFKNPMMTSSCDIQSRKAEQESIEKTASKSVLSKKVNISNDTLTLSDEIVSCTTMQATDVLETMSSVNVESYNSETTPFTDEIIHERKAEIEISERLNENNIDIPINTEHNSEENFDDSVEDDNNCIINTYDNDDENLVTSRHGSGETYTKFTENPNDFDEFMYETDKMIELKKHEIEIDDPCLDLHTPNTSSLISMNKSLNDDVTERTKDTMKHNFSDTLKELKINFQQLLKGAGDAMDLKKDECNPSVINTKLKASDFEHIILFGVNDVVDKDKLETLSLNEEVKLPTIHEKRVIDKKRVQRIYKPNRKYKMLGEGSKNKNDFKTFIVQEHTEDSDSQSITAEAPPLKLPRIDNNNRKRTSGIDDSYDPFAKAARQMKELMASDNNIPQKLQTSHKQTPKDLNRTLPNIRPAKDKHTMSYLRPDNTKLMKDTLNKNYQKTPTLQRMKSFGSTNNDYSNTFGGRCSSFRLNRNESKKSSQTKLNTTFTKSSKENISTLDKSSFNRNSSLNRSFSSYSTSSYSTPKPRDKIPKIATSYHSFQRTTIKQPVKLDKINNKSENKKDFVNLDSILTDDNSSTLTDSNYIDPRLINENDNLPINVNTILNNPDIISSMESLLTTENLPAKFESFSSNTVNNNYDREMKFSQTTLGNNRKNNILNNNTNQSTKVDELGSPYDKMMSSIEQSIASKTSIRDDDSLCEDFDLDEFMTAFDDEVQKQRSENKRSCSSTTRVVKQAELVDSNKSSKCSSPVVKTVSNGNGMIPYNKSMSFNFSSNNIVNNDNLFPSSVKRSSSLLDSIQKKSVSKTDSGKSRHNADLLEQDIMHSLKDFDKFYENESHSVKETAVYNVQIKNGHDTAKRDARAKAEKKNKKNEDVTNGNYTPNTKSTDSAYSSLNRISPSKLSVCNVKESNGMSLEQIPAGSDSSRENDVRSMSSDEFLAMERSAELDEPIMKAPEPPPYKDIDSRKVSEKRSSSRASSRHSGTWQPRLSAELSTSSSDGSLHRRAATPGPRLSRFCHECGSKFPMDTAKFCIECGVKRLAV